jgi:uncharacterized membrane protein
MNMPVARQYGAVASFSFAFLGMILFDIISGHIGAWTLITSLVYGSVGLAAYMYFKNKNSSKTLDYVKFSIFGTLFFDIATGLTVGPILFKQNFMIALAGQIPFTLLHLLGNISFAILLSPAIYQFIIKKRKRQRSLIPAFNTTY